MFTVHIVTTDIIVKGHYFVNAQSMLHGHGQKDMHFMEKSVVKQ